MSITQQRCIKLTGPAYPRLRNRTDSEHWVYPNKGTFWRYTMPRIGDIIGYARVSTTDQDLVAQRDRLFEEGVVRIFEDVISGNTFDRPGLSALLDYNQSGDTLAVIRLDRLGRSLKELLKSGNRRRPQSQRDQSDQPGGADRYDLRCGRVGIPCLWSHYAIRASADFTAHKRRAGNRSKVRANATRNNLS